MQEKKYLFPEADLVNSLKNKSESGFKTLYENYSASLLGVICRIIPDESLAQDILQDAMILIWNNIDKYDVSKGRLFTWILKLTRNLAIDTLRSRRYTNKGRTDDLHDNFDAIDYMKSNTINTDIIGLRKLTTILPPKIFIVLDKVFFQGYTHVDAAKELNLPLGTVKSRINHAITALRKSFEYTSDYNLASLQEDSSSIPYEARFSSPDKYMRSKATTKPILEWKTILEVVYYNDFTHEEVASKLNIKLSEARNMSRMSWSALKKTYMK
ncbi:RNA polymerase sigma factor [Pedobacter sp. MR2016-24]|uniref:RNA polymerase sigma factor n=1 Tax=Pedobacter sp. MR2016-24 TaxID=2994466 RepID=UPI0022453EF8|nr:sigma-70 family RNA polymerase sigma factor [Pedobacter sp. MR2016-24]MCX2486174.1 sigma-70 family RNA polymerase sigma factor [Pedobacter sp. MR2016-24]